MSTATSDQISKVQAILQHLDYAQGERSESRRGAKRVQIRVPLTTVLVTDSTHTPIRIYTRNLSVSGLGFVSRRMFKPHERVAIRLHIDSLPARLLLARITFGRYVSSGLYEMGAEFLECVKDTGHSRVPRHWILESVPNKVLSQGKR